MAGVRQISPRESRPFDKVRYLVTHTHATILDNCQMSIVEEQSPYADHSYWICMRHQATDCICVASVLAYRETRPADEGF